ncbi:hypothetical protein F0U44_14000 [Nocardioides humilatus]|uniref:DUF5667 domain-containing protein n=1 Tax=Nocardioides humilatus TaxID=2607660 RepID=A0A5B1LFV0_9ACTN|nr:DUF5667 domain-containing protein [Nocardioides humilatus]KAA1419533.1 hypothetical protein F0U44_14000 [Nocardioides humilatus]
MTGAFTSRRRAEEFDALVSSAAPATADAAPYVDLLALVAELRAEAPVLAREEFVSDLRSRLVVEAARQARPIDAATRLRLTPKQRSGARERRAATVLGGFAIVAASGSMAMASQTALPGDVLYPVKRAIENVHTNLQSSDADKAETLLAHAQKRLDEAQQLTAEGADAGTVAATLQDFTDQSSQATELALDDYAATGDQETIGELRSFASASMGELDELGDVVPDDARPALITAAQSLMDADSAAFQICPTCGDGEVTQLPDGVAAPAALELPLNAEPTAASIIGLSPDFLDDVEDAIEDTPVKGKPGKHHGGGQTTVDTTPGTPDVGDDVTDDTDDVTNPLEDLGDKIKHDLTPGADNSEVVDSTVTGVVDGLNGLVDALLGN